MDTESLDTPGKRLRWARERAGYSTAKSAAVAMGVSDISMRQYENDNAGYSRHAVKAAAAFGVTVEWLLEAKGSRLK